MTDPFVKSWKMLAASFPNAPQTSNRATMIVYKRTLADLPAAALEAAALSAMGTLKFFPTIAELRDLAFAAIEREAGLPTANEAWGDVCETIRVLGIYGTPRWKHQVTADAVRAVGGYLALCNSNNPAADRAQFIESYNVILARSRSEVRQLPQVHEAIQRLLGSDRAADVERLLSGKVKAL